MAEEEKMVTVYETESYEEACVVKLALEDANVPFSTTNDLVSTVMHFDGMAVTGFQVLEGDVERAQEALAQLEEGKKKREAERDEGEE